MKPKSDFVKPFFEERKHKEAKCGICKTKIMHWYTYCPPCHRSKLSENITEELDSVVMEDNFTNAFGG